jgi:hypothetical protein
MTMLTTQIKFGKFQQEQEVLLVLLSTFSQIKLPFLEQLKQNQ